jgi:coenzyme F420-reducing hydrogenase gamma subunit
MGKSFCLRKGTCKGKRPSWNGEMEEPNVNLEKRASRSRQ